MALRRGARHPLDAAGSGYGGGLMGSDMHACDTEHAGPCAPCARVAEPCRRRRRGVACVATAVCLVLLVLVAATTVYTAVWLPGQSPQALPPWHHTSNSGLPRGAVEHSGGGASAAATVNQLPGWPPLAPVPPFGVSPSLRATAQRTLLLLVVRPAAGGATVWAAAAGGATVWAAVQRGSFYAACGFRVAVVYQRCACGRGVRGVGGPEAQFCPEAHDATLASSSVAVVPLPVPCTATSTRGTSRSAPANAAVTAATVEVEAWRWAVAAYTSPEQHLYVCACESRMCGSCTLTTRVHADTHTACHLCCMV